MNIESVKDKRIRYLMSKWIVDNLGRLNPEQFILFYSHEGKKYRPAMIVERLIDIFSIEKSDINLQVIPHENLLQAKKAECYSHKAKYIAAVVTLSRLDI